MNFRQLDCFLAVGSTLNFSEAAKSLYLSQSTVSSQIQALERDLGFELLDRDRHHVRLTSAGEYLLAQWTDIRRAFDQSVVNARALVGTSGGVLRLGYDGPLGEVWVGAAATLFHEQMPDIDLRLSRKPMGRLSELLFDGALDAAVTVLSEASAGQFEFHPLREGAACVYVSEKNSLAGQEHVTLADLAQQRVISAYAPSNPALPRGTASVLAGHGIDLAGAQVVEDADTAFMAAQANLGVFVASHLCDDFAKRYKVKAVDLDAGLEPAVLGLAWRHPSHAIDTLVRCMEYVLRQG